jgi:ABC-type transport system involved in multi-copper enzyme maturation permease subunit
MTGTLIIAGYTLRECVRRRVFVVVLVLSVLFLGLFWLGTDSAFDEARLLTGQAALDEKVVVGSTLLGLAMFTTLFLGAVLGAFLTLNGVRGDADRGLLQPLVVRPVGRTTVLAGRFTAAGSVCVLYVLVMYAAAVLITGLTGDWWPDEALGPGLGLAAGVLVIAGLSLLGSVWLSATANGIAVFMLFGAGLAAGLLGQIGEALEVDTLKTVAEVTSWALPFEALYQAGLHGLTSETSGITGFVVELGPFGGAQEGGDFLWPWALAYMAVVAGLARYGFARRDL